MFITSDGVSDNFDPVVGKFCSIKKTEVERDLGHADMDPFTGANTFSSASSNPHNNRPSSTKPSQSSVHKTKSAPSTNGITALPDNFFATSVPSTLNHQNQQPRGTLPCVDSFERHELMLLRMADVITNGLNGGGTASRLAKKSSFERQHNFPYGTASSNSSSQNSSAMEKNRRRFARASEVCKNLIQFSYRLSSYAKFFPFLMLFEPQKSNF